MHFYCKLSIPATKQRIYIHSKLYHMRKLFILFFAAALFASCGNTKNEKSDNNDLKEKDEKRKDDDETYSDESSLGNWSDEDKGKLRKEWAKTFAKWKDGLQGEDGFDEDDFAKETKKVVACTLNVLENKFESYAKYKKANDKDHFQSEPELLNEMGNCTDRLMNKYNR